MRCSSSSVTSSTGRTTWGMVLVPLKVRRRGWETRRRASEPSKMRPQPSSERTGEENLTTTHRLVALLKVAALAHQAELVLGVLLRSRAGGPVHQRAGPGVVSGHALRVLPASLWSSEGASRGLAWLNTIKQGWWVYGSKSGARLRSHRGRRKQSQNTLLLFLQVTVIIIDNLIIFTSYIWAKISILSKNMVVFKHKKAKSSLI